jgi:WD40 repeat protein
MVWNPAGTQLALLPILKPVEIHSWPALQPFQTVGAQKHLVSFDFSSDPDVVAFGENSNVATILNFATGKELPLDTGNPQPFVKFSPDAKLLATGGYGTSAKLWSVDSGELVREFDAGLVGGQKGGLTPVFSPDGKLLAVGNRNSITILFDVATGLVRHRLPRTMSQGLKFDPTGKRLAVTYVDGSLGLWDVETGRSLNQSKANAEELYAVDWSPDGSLLVTCGHNASVTVWNADDLSVLNELECPEWVIQVAFSPDGTRLVFAGGSTIATPERYVETWAVP